MSSPLVVAPEPTSQGTSPTPPSPVDLLLPPPHPVNETHPPPPLAQLTPSPSNNRTTLVALGVGIGIGGAIVLVCVGIFIIWYKRMKRMRLGMDVFDYAPPQPEWPKDDPFRGPQLNQQQSTPPGNVFGLPKPSPPLGIPSHSRTSSTEGSAPKEPLFGSSMSIPKHIQQGTSDSKLGSAITTFAYDELVLATNNFSDVNLLGQGGFGYVHKGVLCNGKEVAIKKLKIGGAQGEREFQAEVETISRVHHKHLVLLVGHCISESQRLLVYEYVPNRTLEFHLHGKEKPINWALRMKIALGSAKGLGYLHEDCHPKIIHRDIKSSNILLDENFEAKVADFGLARFYSDADTHVSTRVMGTFGYLAPEYALTGKLTEKSDVFSFGVVLLELITGRRPIDKSENYLDDNIIDWARPLLAQSLENNNFDSLADPTFQKDYDAGEMARMVACASACVRHLARRRPGMSQIIRALEGNLPLGDLNEGIEPGPSTMYGSCGSLGDTSYDTAQYREDLIKFRKMALESMEMTTSECSGPSEYLHPSCSSSESRPSKM